MVRLKQKVLENKLGNHIKFQSHNGSIKTKNGYINVSDYYLFQSHNGSIKTIERKKLT